MVSSVPAGPRSLRRSQPLMFCPEVDDLAVGDGTGRPATGRSSCTRRVGGAGE